MLFPCHNIRTLCFAFWLSLFVLCGGRLWAQGTAPLSPPEDLSTLTGNDLVTVTLHSDIARFQPGQQLTLAVQYDIRPGWHLYWRNPGDNGMPPSLSIKAGPGVVVGTPLYPRPKVFQKKQGDSTETSFGYEGSVCLLVPLSITRSFEGTRLDLALELEWLVCKDICLIGSERRDFSIPAALPQRPPSMDPAGLRLIKLWRNRMPLPAAKTRISASLRGDSLLISGPSGLSRQVRFIPDLTPGVTPAKQVPVSGIVVGSRFTLEVPLDIRPEDALGQPLRVAGLVLLGSYERPRAISVDVPIPLTSREGLGSTGAGSSPTE